MKCNFKFIVYLNLLDLITLTILGERFNYKVPHCGASLWNLLLSPFASLLGTNIRVRILFSNALNVRDHALQPYSTTGYIIIFIFEFLSS